MKAEVLYDIKHEGNLDPEEVKEMSLDENALAHLMSVLTDLYSNPTLAVIREYATNAFDSHREAGNDAPIQIQLPNAMNPVYIVRDFGVGLSVTQVIEQFSKYGFSSKRETNEQVGMLGLGCKSALTYTSQFTLIVTKDGERAFVNITRNEKGIGSVQIISRFPTDEPNGVEVQIPVTDAYSFNREARQFFSFWAEGTVLLDGEAPESIWNRENIIEIDPDIFMIPELHGDYLVMGNVPYPVEQRHRIWAGHDYSGVVVRIGIGDANFTPSRESLHYTPKTLETLNIARRFVMDNMVKKLQAEIDAIDDRSEVLKFAQEQQALAQRLGHTLTWRCEQIPLYGITIKHTKDDALLEWNTLRDYYDPKKHRSATNRGMGALQIPHLRRALHVTGFTSNNISSVFKDRLIKHIEDNALNVNFVLLYEKPCNSPWLEDVHTITLEEVRAIKLQTTKRTKTIKQLSSRYGDFNNVEGIDPKFKTIVVVYARDQVKRQNLAEYLWGSQSVGFGTVACVIVNLNQYDKYLRDEPRAVSVEDFVKKQLSEFTAKLTEAQKNAIHGGGSKQLSTAGLRWLRKLENSGDILDPLIQEVFALDTMKTDDSKVNSWNALRTLALRMGVPVPDLPDPAHLAELGDKAAILRERYPFLRMESFYFNHLSPKIDELESVEYFNALYTYKVLDKEAAIEDDEQIPETV